MTVLGTITSDTNLTASNISDFAEAVDDRLGDGSSGVLRAGTNVTLDYSDVANTLTINSAGGGGGGFIEAVSDTTNIDLTVTGTTLSADLPTTSTPQVLRLGVGGAAGASGTGVTIGSSVTGKVLSDVALGDHVDWIGVGATPQRWDIRHGTSAAPVTALGPTLQVSRTEAFTSDQTNGAEWIQYAAICGMNETLSTSGRAQPVGVAGGAASSSTTAEVFPTRNPDACGVIGTGAIRSAGVGRALGGHFEAYTDSSAATPKLTAFEAQARNHASDSTYSATSGDTRTTAINLTTGGTKKVASGIRFNRAGTAGLCEFDVGIAFSEQNAVDNASIRDDGTAARSIYILGTHATAAIAVGGSAGKVVIGATSTALSTKAAIYSSSTSERGLTVLAAAGTPTVNVFQVSNSSDSEVFGVSYVGNVRVASALLMLNSSNLGYIRFTEQATQPSAGTQDTTCQAYMKADKFVIQFNNAGTTRYFTLDLTQSGATPAWAQSTTGP